MSLMQDIASIKQQYRDVFQQARAQLDVWFIRQRDGISCNVCDEPPHSPDSPLHPGCGYRAWQEQILLNLEQGIGRRIIDDLARIRLQREEEGACHQCGVCCSLASSPFDYATLLQKAQSGDTFALQFTQVFQPYASADAARAAYPQLVDEMLSQTEGDVYFYACPYLSATNQCTLYTDPRRPQLCADYPENPLVLMYQGCGYQPWRQAYLPTTLMAHATLELCQYYAERILAALKRGEQEH